VVAADYVGAKPMTVSLANGIDTLHGTTRQELHQILSMSRPWLDWGLSLPPGRYFTGCLEPMREFWRESHVVSRENDTSYCGRLDKAVDILVAPKRLMNTLTDSLQPIAKECRSQERSGR
jgi:hypothetical protein